MNKKASMVVVLVLFFLLINIGFSSGVCTSTDTPRINPINYFEIGEGELFVHDFNLTNMDEQGIFYSYALFDRRLTGISISSGGVLRFEPSSDDVGVSKIGVIAVKESCAGTLVVTFKIFAKPKITSFEPKNSSVQINQTQSVYFRVKAIDKDDNETLIYEWLLDSGLINESFNKTNYIFRPGYELSGVHNISARVTDSHNLSDIKTWYVQVSKVNRAPTLLFPVPNFMVFQNTATGAYNLNDYFYDPDGGMLSFSYRQVNPAFEIKGTAYANISASIDKTGFVTYDPALNTSGYAYFVFTAYDIMNKSVESNFVKVDVVSSDKFNTLKNVSRTDFCGDYVCSAVEDCSNCPFDCGPCEDEEIGCMPDWNCSDWGPCMPGGFMTRNCTDIANCGDNRSKPDEIRICEYNATCSDGLKNGIEEGVDCGGPCDPCPTCNDSIQNQGEEGVDCGGPCLEICPSCTDGVKNQDESDVDCGGVCAGCAGNQSCLKNKDCESLRCEYLICTFPSCEDGIKNQEEEGVDCGGPCTKRCGTCSDGVQNGGEMGVDCGGLCRPCPRCDDGVKNGDERLADCGGNCRKCNFSDYFQAYYAGFIILFIILGLIPFLLISYFFYLLTHPEKARGLYEHNSTFAFLVGANKLFRKIRVSRKKSPAISEEVAKNFINELNDTSKRPEINDKELYERIQRIYAALLGLPEEYDNNIFNMRLRASKIPLLMKILFMGFYKKAEILPLATFVPQEVKLDMIVEMKFLLGELVKG
ncbi:hypothetical protein KY348_06335 [Candidatus Woesearchaeota archaeon]|nr:hypothetical protein [Candidatus Woesearchaeota archaeon]